MSQNPFSQKVRIYTLSAAALTVAAVLLRCVNFLFFFDSSVGYFDNVPTHLIYRALCLLTVVWLFTSVIFIPRYSFPGKTRPTPSNTSKITALLCAVFAAGSAFFFYENMRYYGTYPRIYRLLIVFSLIAAVYFLFQYLGNKPAEYRALLGYTTLLWLGLILCVTYLNLYVPMNSPLKITVHMAILGMMLHIIEEARMLTEHGFRIAYLACTLIGILNCAVASVPVLLAYAVGTCRNIDYLFFAVLSLAFLLYLIPRALDCYRLLIVTPQATQEEIDADKEKKAREKEEKKNKKNKKKDAEAQAPTEQAKGDDTHVR